MAVKGTLTVNNIGTDTAGDNYLVEVSGLVKKRTPAEVLSDIGAQASGFYVTSNADDTMSGQLNLIKTTAQLQLSFDVNDYATFLVEESGNLTIASVNDGSAHSKIQLKKGGSSDTQYLVLGDGADHMRVSSNGAFDLKLFTNEGTNSGFIELQNAANGDISITPNGSGDVILGVSAGSVQFATNSFLDANGDSLFARGGPGSGTIVNQLTLGNAVSGNPPFLQASGTDANVNLELKSKGTGQVQVTHTATATTTGFKVDSNLSGTASSAGTGLHIDFDRTIPASGTNSHVDIGLDIDVNSATKGTGLFYGATISVVGTADGTSTATGILVDADDADTNIGVHINTTGTHLKLTAAADPVTDYATIAVADTGDLTIATIGDGTTDSDLTLDADGALILDPANGKYVAKNNGTEFSVTSSAFAGMILGYRGIGEDVGHAAYTLTTSFAVPNSAMTVRFIAPPSGIVEVFVQIWHNASTSNRSLSLGLSDNATYNTIGIQYEQIARYPDETDDSLINHRWFITGLTAGDTYNYWLGAKVNITAAYLNWGGDASGRYPDFIMKVTALPKAVADFAVYG